jgi:Kef-type K+ transport system membrane component KefB
MSITAFPVLARILVERNLLATRAGAMALACAAFNDVTAWIILAAVVVIVRAGEAMPLGVTLAGLAVFVGVMWTVVRPQLRRLQAHVPAGGPVPHDALAAILLIALLSAVATEALGVHTLFGAFFAGAMMPKSPAFVQLVTERLEDLTVVLLLPLFFAITGLKTSIGLLDDAALWGICVAIVVLAIAGKFVGSALAAHLTGMEWREAATVGALMNTRGLMELVILNVGLEIGVISPALFTMMVLMAVVTTAMTTPAIDLLRER